MSYHDDLLLFFIRFFDYNKSQVLPNRKSVSIGSTILSSRFQKKISFTIFLLPIEILSVLNRCIHRCEMLFVQRERLHVFGSFNIALNKLKFAYLIHKIFDETTFNLLISYLLFIPLFSFHTIRNVIINLDRISFCILSIS